MRLWRPATGLVDGVREPAVAGRFYSADSAALAAEVDGHLAAARQSLASGREGGASTASLAPAGTPPDSESGPMAVVAPHAGYVYSGATAGFAYAALDPARVERVVILGPAHHHPVDGIGVSSALAWRTPLGEVPVDRSMSDALLDHAGVVPGDAAHGPEHSIEVQVPFLQRVLAEGWQLVPLIVGADRPGEVADVISRCVELPRTLVVISTDLSHYLDYEAAVARDAETIRAVEQVLPDAIGASDACGRFALKGLLTAAQQRGWSPLLLDARNSGDTAGDRDRVVGYAAFAVRTGGAPQEQEPAMHESATSGRSEPAAGRISPSSRAALLGLARRTINEALAGDGSRPFFDAATWQGADPVFADPGAAFVTLRTRSGGLLGCIGSLTPRQPLVADVAERAFDAAFRDPRFPALTPERARDLVVEISVLSPTRPMPCSTYDELVSRIEPGLGVVVTAGRHRATFLPAVWEQLPDPAAFVEALWRKAGLAPGDWPHRTTIDTYGSESFAEA